MMFARCFLFLVLIHKGAEAAFNPCLTDADFDGTKVREEHCQGDEGFKPGTKEPLDKAKCTKHGCDPGGEDGCTCEDKVPCEAYGATWTEETCDGTTAAWMSYGVTSNDDIDKTKCDLKKPEKWKGHDGSSFKQTMNYIAGTCCKSYPDTMCGAYDGHFTTTYLDSACTKKHEGGAPTKFEIGKVTDDPMCVASTDFHVKLECTSTGASGKMTGKFYLKEGGKACGGTPLSKEDFDFGEYSHQDAKKFLEGGCVKHYKEPGYLKLNKAAPASVIPPNFCGPAPTGAGAGAGGATTTAASAGSSDASHASPIGLGPIAVLAAAMGSVVVAHL